MRDACVSYNTVDHLTLPAWHDTSLTIAGPAVVDLVQHFCERWNFVKKIKYVS